MKLISAFKHQKLPQLSQTKIEFANGTARARTEIAREGKSENFTRIPSHYFPKSRTYSYLSSPPTHTFVSKSCTSRLNVSKPTVFLTIAKFTDQTSFRMAKRNRNRNRIIKTKDSKIRSYFPPRFSNFPRYPGALCPSKTYRWYIA